MSSVRINKNIEAQHSDDILRIMSVRIFRLVTKICVKNILRIFQAHFRENVKNTEPGRKFHHSYKKSVYVYAYGRPKKKAFLGLNPKFWENSNFA